MAQIFIILATILGLILTGCDSPKSVSELSAAATDEKDPLFSNRQQIQMPDMMVLQLPTPALLKESTSSGKDEPVAAEKLQQINAEQEELIARVQAISAKIKVVYRYKWLLNGIALVVPAELASEVGAIANTASAKVVPDGYFSRPEEIPNPKPANFSLGDKSSVTFIGAHQVHEQLGITGAGQKVGIIDTGIDFTHIALGGVGTPQAYAAINPSAPTEAFPNDKVVGGYDFVGSDFGGADIVPKPDANPLDEAGHGTHVAATVAGLGDDLNTYSGVAPDADLYALKVFGKSGGTSDTAVIAALEFAVDPNGDGLREDQLDIINLSLGSDYGHPHTLYQQAIEVLVQSGTFVVAAAGNSGPVDYIVGAPSTTDSALSVAAVVDDLPHNIQFATVAFVTPSFGDVIAEATEGPISLAIKDAPDVQAPLVYVGVGKDLTDEQKLALKGNVALIDRGEISFYDKLKAVSEAGAVGAVIVNNEPGVPAIQMGGEPDQKVGIPAIMVTYEVGLTLKSELAVGEVKIRFKNETVILKDELVDTLTSFSSYGPRAEDSLLKPEIAAPGAQILSAQMGTGVGGIMFSGTSMAAPHVAGVMALLKQIHPSYEPGQLKSLVMSTAKTLTDVDGQVYSTSQQGAGRVEAFEAATQSLVSHTSSFSLGSIDALSNLQFSEALDLTNHGDEAINLRLESQLSSALSASAPGAIRLAPGETQRIEIQFQVNERGLQDYYQQGQGFIRFVSAVDGQEQAKLPVLSILNRNSDITLSSVRQGEGDRVVLDLTNQSTAPGPAYLFNLISQDNRKEQTPGPGDFVKSVACDLQSAGYRIISKAGENGQSEEYLQVAAQLYDSVSVWKQCEVSVQLDANDDGIAEQEMGGLNSSNLGDLGGDSYVTVLLDAKRAKEIRSVYETSVIFQDPVAENYRPAIEATGAMTIFNHSTLAIMEVPLAAVQKNTTGGFSIKVATLHNVAESVEADDFLADAGAVWTSVPSTAVGSAYYDMAESVLLQGGETQSLVVRRGQASGSGIFYFPANNRSADQQFTLVP